MSKKADVVIIGGGITGCAILYQLAKYDLKCVLLEKEPDIAAGTTKANSAILHAGFDAKPGSLKAKLNVKGNALYHDLKDDHRQGTSGKRTRKWSNWSGNMGW